MGKVSIVMYHYVRDLARSRYPEIKGLALDLFVEQLGYIQKHYNVISMDALLDTIGGGKPLPPRAAILTFDDAYIDHFTNVYPILDEAGLQGCFFPPAIAVVERKMLDIHKIHYILASVADKSDIIRRMFTLIDGLKAKYNLLDGKQYFERFTEQSRYDGKNVLFIKRMMQKGLPEAARKDILQNLFHDFVAGDETKFAAELYVNIDQIRCMRRHGQFIGNHGYDHYWLNTLDTERQEREIDLSLRFLRDIGCDLDRWVMCYPSGAVDSSLLSIIKTRKCAAGLTTVPEIADISNPFQLGRLDTNDLPKARDAAPCEWTKKMDNA